MWLIDFIRGWICPKPVEPVEPVQPPFIQQTSDDRMSSADIGGLFGSTEEISINFGNLHITDRAMKLVDIEHMKGFLAENPVSSRKYVKEKHDCDDFAYILQGDITRWDSDLAFGIVHGRTVDSSGHAWNVCIGTDRKIWFIEPQTDGMWKPVKFWDIWFVVM